MKILLTAIAFFSISSAHAATSVNVSCVSTSPNSQLGNLVIYDVQNVYTFNPDLQDGQYAGIGGDWDGEQTIEAEVAADDTTSFNATNECDNDFAFTFKTDELKKLINGEIQSIDGQTSWGSMAGPENATDAIHCTVTAE